jgi:hypothetical protein
MTSGCGAECVLKAHPRTGSGPSSHIFPRTVLNLSQRNMSPLAPVSLATLTSLAPSAATHLHGPEGTAASFAGGSKAP